MAKKPINVLKTFYETGDRPTQAQFEDLIDSFIHKDTGVVIIGKEFDQETGVLTLEFSDSTALNVPIPQGFTIAEIEGLIDALDSKVDKEVGKGLSTNDYTAQEKAKVQTAEDHVNDGTIHVSAGDRENWDGKQDAEAGKGLSTNDYTDAEAAAVASVTPHIENQQIHTSQAEKDFFGNKTIDWEANEALIEGVGTYYRYFNGNIYEYVGTLPFTTVDLEAELAEDPTRWLKKLSSEVKGYQNTIIKGIGPLIVDKHSLGDNLRLADDFGNLLGSFTPEMSEEYITNFEVIGNDLYCNISVNYIFEDAAFGGGSSFGDTVTAYIDLDGKLRKAPVANLNGCPLLVEVYTPELLLSSVGSNPLMKRFYAPRLQNIDGNLASCPQLNIKEGDFESVRIISGAMGGITFPTNTLDPGIFPNLEQLIPQDFFKAHPEITIVKSPNLTIMGNNTVRDASNVTVFETPKLEIVGTQCFRNANALLVADFPLVTEVGADNGINSFQANGFQIINLPKCKVLGNSTGNTGVFNGSYSGTIIYINDFLRTNNAGGMDGDLTNAISRGAKVVFVTDHPVPFENYIGWSSHTDSQYTSASPLAVVGNSTYVNLPNDSAVTIDTYKPIDIPKLYDEITQKVTGREGDSILVGVSFAVRPTTATATSVTVIPDIGGAIGEIAEYAKDQVFAKGQNVEQRFYHLFDAFTLDTWEANGAQLKVKANAAVEIYGIKYKITVITRG